MQDPVIKVENLGKQYKLGLTHTDLLSERLGTALRAVAKTFAGKNRKKTASGTEEFQQEESFWALQDVNFEIRQGEVVGIIGRNGAGKSTLLKILSRITSPTTGRVDMYGRVASLLEVGTGFHPELTGRENIFLNGAILGMGKEEVTKKFDEIVVFAGVEKFVDTPVKRYSSGMYVRLAFAVAAHLDPEIFIIDEVLAVGDTAFQRKCLNKMEEVSGMGRTVLFVSHNMASIKRLCGNTLLLDEGRLIDYGGSSAMIAEYYQRMQKQNSSVEIPENQHKTITEFKITGLKLLKGNLTPADIIHAGEDFCIQIDLFSSKTFDKVYLGMDLHREGVLLTNMCIDDVQISERKKISLVCAINGGVLRPGFYEIHIGATDIVTGRPLDYIPAVMSFQILAINIDGKNDVHERDKGLIRLPIKWSFTE